MTKLWFKRLQALELQPTHKAALVARSQCHLKLGDAASALRDAETSFEGKADQFIRGLYQYAEALYNLGQFERALIAYHRYNQPTNFLALKFQTDPLD